jgi:NAD(P)H-hydrate epimerase
VSLVDNYAYTAAEVREIDRRAIAALGGDSYALMQRAGAAAFRVARARHPEARSWLVCCGRGNNGGDGYVVATQARAAGVGVVVWAAAGPPNTTDAARARADFLAGGGHIVEAAPERSDLVFDAVLGIGSVRAPEGAVRTMIETINAMQAPVVALDLPSGLDADSGHAAGVAVDADLSVCFIAWKRGLFTGQGPALSGARVLESLAVNASSFPPPERALALTSVALRRALLPRRSPTAHKGQFGHVLAIGGDAGYGGAIRLAAEAALRSGAGLISVATRGEHVAALLAARPELMVRGVERHSDLEPLLARASVIAIGPGLGQGAWSTMLLDAALASAGPLVLDADALNLIATRGPQALPNTVITPHPGEAARLLGTDIGAIQRDRFAAATALAQAYGCAVLLKGAGTVIATRAGLHALCPVACPALASGGMGDVLTGVIAALIAQGLAPADAAAVGADAHACAGERAASVRGDRGVLALDLIEPLRGLLNP